MTGLGGEIVEDGSDGAFREDFFQVGEGALGTDAGMEEAERFQPWDDGAEEMGGGRHCGGGGGRSHRGDEEEGIVVRVSRFKLLSKPPPPLTVSCCWASPD